MTSSASSSSLPFPRLIGGSLLLMIAIVAVFFPATGGDFVYDDLILIQQNAQVAELSNIPGLFLSGYWEFGDGELANVGYYRPLTMTLITLVNVWGGGGPEPLHWLSLVIYAGACIAAWRFAARLLKSEGAGFFAALLFAMHPVHVESVAWISSMHDALFALFGFMSLSRLLDWIDDEESGLPWSCALWFALSLLSKDTALVLLPSAALLYGMRRQNPGAQSLLPQLLRALVPMGLVLVAYYGLRAVAFGNAWAGFDASSTDLGVGWLRLVVLRIEVLGGAIGLLAWPAELNLFRSFKPELPLGSAEFTVGIIGSGALLLGIVIAWMRRSRGALCLLLLLPITLLPILLRIESLVSFPLSERYLFLPVIVFTGLFMHLIWDRLPRGIAIGVSLALCVALGARSLARLPDWANQRALFTRALEQNPRNPNVHWGLARIYLDQYRATQNLQVLSQARTTYESGMDLLEEALRPSGRDIFSTHDDHLQMNLGLGWCLMFEAEVDGYRDYASVREVFNRVIEYRPNSEQGYIGLGVAWLAEGDPNEAGVALRKALKLNPLSPEAHRNMGLLYMRIEEWAEAVKEFRHCTKLRDRTSDYVFLARALFESKDLQGAEAAAREAHERQPTSPDPMVLIGQVAERTKRFGEAIAWLNRAVEVAPRHGTAHLHRGKTLANMKGKNKEAVKALIQACALLPNSFEAHHDIAVLLLDSTEPEKAVPFFLVAYAKRPRGHDIRMKRAAAAIHRDKPRTLGALANIDIDRNDLASGRKWINQALLLSPQDPAINFTHGMLLLKEEQPQKALKPLRLAALALPQVYTAQMEYADVLLGLKHEIEAEPFLARGLILLEDENMAPDVKDLTRDALKKAILRINEMKNQVGPVQGR
jgi:tetratricopeptide (TPR) repeat protein